MLNALKYETIRGAKIIRDCQWGTVSAPNGGGGILDGTAKRIRGSNTICFCLYRHHSTACGHL